VNSTFSIRMLVFFVAGILVTSSAVFAEKQRLYIGTYTNGESTSLGIYTSVLDEETGTLSSPVLAAASENPSFLAFHPTGPWLYAVNELLEYDDESQGAVSAYAVNRETGELTLLNQKASGGGAPCHLVVDATGRCVLAANYFGGNTVVLPLSADGALQDMSCLIQHTGSGPNQARQQEPHAHSVNLSHDNRNAYVADLGTDRIWIFHFDPDQGQIAAATLDSAAGVAGGGPRHLALHSSGRLAWSNNEMGNTIMGFRRDPRTGRLTMIQELSPLPDDFLGRSHTAECLLHPSERFVYVSNRGHDSIAAYRIADDGQLALIEIESSGGEEPRNFRFSPNGRWMLSENQNSNTVVVFRVEDNGGLTRTDTQISVGRPVCVRFLP